MNLYTSGRFDVANYLLARLRRRIRDTLGFDPKEPAEAPKITQAELFKASARSAYPGQTVAVPVGTKIGRQGQLMFPDGSQCVDHLEAELAAWRAFGRFALDEVNRSNDWRDLRSRILTDVPRLLKGELNT